MRGNGRGTSPLRGIAMVASLAVAPGAAGAAEPPLAGCYERVYEVAHLLEHKAQIPVRLTLSIAAKDFGNQANGYVAEGVVRVWVRGNNDRSFDSIGACRVAGNGLACIGSVSAAEAPTCGSQPDGLLSCRIDPDHPGGFSVEGRPDGVVVLIPDRLELLRPPYDAGPYLNLSSSNVEHRAFQLKKARC